MKIFSGEFKKKLKRRARWTLHQYVPNNSSLRPKESFDSNSSDNQCKLSIIYPNYTTTLEIPEAFLSKVSDYADFDERMEGSNNIMVRSDNYKVGIIPGGRIYTNNIDLVALVTSDNRIVEEVSYFAVSHKIGYGEWARRRFMRQKYFKKPQKIKGRVCNLVIGAGGSEGNYFHWLIDIIPRLHLIEKAGLLGTIDFFLLSRFDLDFHKDAFKKLGIEESKVIIADEDTHIQADSVVGTSNVRGHQSNLIPAWAYDYLIERFTIDIPASDQINIDRVFISRKDSKRRVVENEDQLFKIAKAHGFERFTLSELNINQKISLFRNAKYLIIQQGAGLANLLFCNRGATVLTYYSGDFVTPDTYSMVDLADINFDYLISEPSGNISDYRSGMNLGFQIDVDEFDKKLKRMMGSIVKGKQNV